MSSDQKVVVSRQGVGFCGILFIVLLLLKVGIGETAVVGWSWWWIAAPLWAPFALGLSVIAVILLVAAILFLFGLAAAAICDRTAKKKARKRAGG